MDSYIIQVHYLEKEGFGPPLRCHASVQELSAADVSAVLCRFWVYTVPVIVLQGAGARNDAPCSSVSHSVNVAAGTGDFSHQLLVVKKPGCLIIGGTWVPSAQAVPLKRKRADQRESLKLVCDHDQINRISRNISLGFRLTGIG